MLLLWNCWKFDPKWKQKKNKNVSYYLWFSLDGKEFRLLWWLRNSLKTFMEAGIKTVSSSPLSAALEHSVFTRRLQLGTLCVSAPGLQESGILKCQTAYRSRLLLKYEEGHMKIACSHNVSSIVISTCRLNIVQTAAAFFLNLSLKEIYFWLKILAALQAVVTFPTPECCRVSQTSGYTFSFTSNFFFLFNLRVERKQKRLLHVSTELPLLCELIQVSVQFAPLERWH